MERQPLTEEQRAAIAAGKKVDPVFNPVTKITENYPLIRWKDPFDFFPDPAAYNDQVWGWVFDRVWLSTADLQNRMQGDDAPYMLVDLPGVGGDGDETETRPNETKEEADARRQGKHAVITMWGMDGTKIVMVGDQLLQLTRNQYGHNRIPFVCWSTEPKRGSLYGESEMEDLRDLQTNISVSDTLRRDGYLRAQNDIFIADPSVKIPKGRKPGMILRAIQGARLERMTFDSQQGPSFSESENMLSAMQEMSGAAGVAGFNNPADLNRMAATVGGIAQEEGNMRMMMKKLWFRLMTSRAAKFMVQLDHQYLSELEIQMICGSLADGYKPIAPEQIPMFIDVLPEAMSEQLGLMAQRNSDIELLNIVGPMNGQTMHDGSVFSVKPAIEDTLKSYQRDSSKYFNFPEPQAIDPMTGQPIMGSPTDPNGMPIPQQGGSLPGVEPGPMQPQQGQASAQPGPHEDVQAMGAKT